MSIFRFAKISRLTRMVQTSFLHHQLWAKKYNYLKTISWTTIAEDSLETPHMKPLITCFIIIYFCFSQTSKFLVLNIDVKSEQLKFCHLNYITVITTCFYTTSHKNHLKRGKTNQNFTSLIYDVITNTIFQI